MKDLREMCLNNVTLDDIRRLYGVNAMLEDVESVLPSHLIGELGMFPSHELATNTNSRSERQISNEVQQGETAQMEFVPRNANRYKSLSESYVESQQAQEQEVNLAQDAGDKNEREEKVNTGEDVAKEEARPIEKEKEDALTQLFTTNQQVAREIQLAVSSLYNQLPSPVSWHTLLALCLLTSNSNMLDVLTSLEILSYLDGNT